MDFKHGFILPSILILLAFITLSCAENSMDEKAIDVIYRHKRMEKSSDVLLNNKTLNRNIDSINSNKLHKSITLRGGWFNYKMKYIKKLKKITMMKIKKICQYVTCKPLHVLKPIYNCFSSLMHKLESWCHGGSGCCEDCGPCTDCTNSSNTLTNDTDSDEYYGKRSPMKYKVLKFDPNMDAMLSLLFPAWILTDKLSILRQYLNSDLASNIISSNTTIRNDNSIQNFMETLLRNTIRKGKNDERFKKYLKTAEFFLELMMKRNYLRIYRKRCDHNRSNDSKMCKYTGKVDKGDLQRIFDNNKYKYRQNVNIIEKEKHKGDIHLDKVKDVTYNFRKILRAFDLEKLNKDENAVRGIKHLLTYLVEDFDTEKVMSNFPVDRYYTRGPFLYAFMEHISKRKDTPDDLKRYCPYMKKYINRNKGLGLAIVDYIPSDMLQHA